MRKRTAAIVLAAAVLAFAASASFAAKDRLIIADQYDATTMDPIGHSDVPSARCCYELYDTLVFRNAKGEIVPGLAERWEIISPSEYKFYLRKGVKFHNGEELKASDVAFSVKRATTDKGAKIRSYSQDVKEVKVLDDYTCVILLKSPNTAFFNSLPHWWGSIVNQKAVEEAGDDYGTMAKPPVGTGPFKFLSWNKNDNYVLERFEDFWGEKPGYKYLEVRSVPEASNRTIELETKGVDIAYPIIANDLNRINENPELTLIQKPGNSITYMGFNAVKAPFNDARVRRAVSAALDIVGMHKAVFERFGKNGSTPRSIVPSQIQYNINDQLPEHVRDVELAKQLLKEAGIPEGTTVEIWTNERKERQDMSQIMMAQLEEVGLKVQIRVLEWGAFLSGLMEKTHDMYLLGWSNSVPDANFSMSPLLETGAGANYDFFSNAELDALMEKGRRTPDGPERAAVYKEAQELFNELVPMIALHSEDLCVGIQNYVKGFEVGSTEVYNFRTISLAD